MNRFRYNEKEKKKTNQRLAIYPCVSGEVVVELNVVVRSLHEERLATQRSTRLIDAHHGNALRGLMLAA